MFTRLLSTALILGTAAVSAPAAHAQSANCAPRDLIVESLENRFSEQLTGGGLQNATTLVEVWSSEQTGTFTVLVTRANGISCVVSTGQNWTDIAPEMRVEGTPS